MFWSFTVHAISEISIKADRIEHDLVDAKDVAVNIKLKQATPVINLNSAIKQKSDKDWTQHP